MNQTHAAITDDDQISVKFATEQLNDINKKNEDLPVAFPLFLLSVNKEDGGISSLQTAFPTRPLD